MTRRIQIVSADLVQTAELEPAATWLKGGGIVAFPTDTFYGLAVDPGSDAAVGALFDLKGRDATAAIPLIAASTRQVAGESFQRRAFQRELHHALGTEPRRGIGGDLSPAFRTNSGFWHGRVLVFCFRSTYL